MKKRGIFIIMCTFIFSLCTVLSVYAEETGTRVINKDNLSNTYDEADVTKTGESATGVLVESGKGTIENGVSVVINAAEPQNDSLSAIGIDLKDGEVTVKKDVTVNNHSSVTGSTSKGISVVENTGSSGVKAEIDGNLTSITDGANASSTGIDVLGNVGDVNISVGSVLAESKAEVQGICVVAPSDNTTVTIISNKVSAKTAGGSNTYGTCLISEMDLSKIITIVDDGIVANGTGSVYGTSLLAYGGGIDEFVHGDINSSNIGVDISSIGGNVKFVCDGTISGDKVDLNIDKGTIDSGVVDSVDLRDFEASAGKYQIVVYELKSKEGATLIDVNPATGQTVDDVKNGILYIIKDADTTVKNADAKYALESGRTEKITVGDTTYEYYVTTKNDAYFTVANGYKLTSTTTAAQPVEVSPGRYLVVIPDGGGVTLKAVLIAVSSGKSSGGGGGFASTEKPKNTGSVGNPVRDGKWTLVNGKWTYSTNAQFVNTWGYIGTPDVKSEPHWYYFDKSGNMLTGWQLINDKWYYFSEAKDTTEGIMAANTKVGGETVGADGAWIPKTGQTQPAAVTQAQAAAAAQATAQVTQTAQTV